MRISWDEYFMVIAKIISMRSTCNSRPTGAVIVRDNHILATGYNGAVAGAPHCIDFPDTADGTLYCFRRVKKVPDYDKYNYCKASHAEVNAIAQAAKLGISLVGSTLYCTLAPCYVCLKLLVTAGIKDIYFEYVYESLDDSRDVFWKSIVKESGVKTFEQILISAKTIESINELFKSPASVRRLKSF